MIGSIVKQQLECVVWQHLLHDLGQAGKHAADVQHFRDRAQQLSGRVGQERAAGRQRVVLRDDRQPVAISDSMPQGLIEGIAFIVTSPRLDPQRVYL